MTDTLDLARKVFNEMKPSEVVEYTCTAINSLRENDVDGEYSLCYTTTRQAIKNFIINTLIVNEITNGFRDKETGELIYGEIQYGVIG